MGTCHSLRRCKVDGNIHLHGAKNALFESTDDTYLVVPPLIWELIRNCLPLLEKRLALKSHGLEPPLWDLQAAYSSWLSENMASSKRGCF
jgi:hypothetical protein